jgi:hypothetical protein
MAWKAELEAKEARANEICLLRLAR